MVSFLYVVFYIEKAPVANLQHADVIWWQMSLVILI